MRAEDIFEALTDISDKNLAAEAPRRRHWWVPLTAMAAVLALAVGLLPRMGGSAGNNGNDLESNGRDSDGSTEFMSYAGPAFPLSALEEGLTAQRELIWDFSPWQPVWYSIDDMMTELSPEATEAERAEARAQYEEWFPAGGYERTSNDVLLRDKYTLSGTGEYTLVYPFVSSFRDLKELSPVLQQNGRQLDGTLYAGTETESAGWQDCLNVYESGESESVMTGQKDLTDMPVIVYRLTDISAPDESENALNPTLALNFAVDYQETQVLSYGFSGAVYDRETGTMQQNTSVGSARWRTQPHILIVIGQDIGSISISGYRSGGCEAGNEMEGFSGNIRREETTLGAVLNETIGYYQSEQPQYEQMEAAGAEYNAFYNTVCANIERYREQINDLESVFSQTMGVQRVFYLMVPIRAAEGDEILITLRKEASFDYSCAQTENRGVYGYDLLAVSGKIQLDSQSVGVEHFELCTIVRQNLGLDPARGILQVQLDPTAEQHYYLEVRRTA